MTQTYHKSPIEIRQNTELKTLWLTLGSLDCQLRQWTPFDCGTDKWQLKNNWNFTSLKLPVVELNALTFTRTWTDLNKWIKKMTLPLLLFQVCFSVKQLHCSHPYFVPFSRSLCFLKLKTKMISTFNEALLLSTWSINFYK